jgi:hypothetical protein
LPPCFKETNTIHSHILRDLRDLLALAMVGYGRVLYSRNNTELVGGAADVDLQRDSYTDGRWFDVMFRTCNEKTRKLWEIFIPFPWRVARAGTRITEQNIRRMPLLF